MHDRILIDQESSMMNDRLLIHFSDSQGSSTVESSDSAVNGMDAKDYGWPRLNANTKPEVQQLLENPFSLKDAVQSNDDNASNDSEKKKPIIVEIHACPNCARSSGQSMNHVIPNSVDPAYIVINNQAAMSSGKASIGKLAPDFETTAVVDGEFKKVKLSDYKGKYVVLFFWPRDFTFVCPTEIIAFSDRVGEFRSINCEVLGISTDSHFTHFAWIQQPRKEGGLGDMNIPLLSDATHGISRSYGILKEDEGCAYRGLFIIDAKGFLRQITINDLQVGRDVDETLRLVQAFQYTDEHGDVCPAGWRPGKEPIKPSFGNSPSSTGNK